MIYKQIELDDKFHEFLMNNIYEAKDFARSNPQMECFISVSFPERTDCLDISVFLNYVPNHNISQELKDSLTEERKSRNEFFNNSMKLLDPTYKGWIPDENEPDSWEWGCYGSHGLGLSLEEFRKLESTWKASNREDSIDDILN